MYCILIIDGIDMTLYIEEDGFSVEIDDIDAPKSGRTMDGKMHRAKVATKVKLGLSFLPVPQKISSVILNSIKKTSMTVKYLDPMYGMRTCEMYASPKQIKLKRVYIGGEIYWSGLSFRLIEM